MGRPTGALIAGVCALILVISGCSGDKGASSAGDDIAGKEGATAWERVTEAIGVDGHVDKVTALDASALAVMPLPGVETPPGREPLLSGSGAVRWLLGHWDELDGAQRDAIIEHLGHDPFTAEPSSPAGPTHEFSRGGARQRFIAAGDSPGAAPYRQLLDKYLNEIGAKLTPPHTLGIPTRIVMDSKQLAAGDAYTFALGPKQGHAVECEIHITPQLPKLGSRDIEVAVAHEAFHCIQSDIFPTVKDGDDTLGAAPWIVEGQAAWVGEVVAGPDDGQYAEDWWKAYLLTPRTPLTQRTYDAIGFYSHMAETGNDPWKVLVPMLTAGDNSVAFQVATSAARDPLLTSWPSGLFRRQAWGSEWDTTGPGIPGSGVRGPVQMLSVSGSGTETLGPSAFANELTEVDTAAEVTVVGTDGYARIRDNASLEVVAQPGIEVLLCTRKDAKCVCPDESGPPLTPATSPLEMGSTGGSKSATVTIRGQSLGDYCKARTQKKPSREAWCADVIRVNTKYGYLVGEPPRYLAPSDLTVDMIRGIVDETLAHEQEFLAITPTEIVGDVQMEMRVFHEMQSVGYSLSAIQAAPPGFRESQGRLMDYQVKNCGILPPPGQ
ncbi:MAG: hypothetical protein DYH08_02370 [Actinobacteria bacterium ATB1]|nr:hypothetical protein [Actinobacteria bacterium ATB1]